MNEKVLTKAIEEAVTAPQNVDACCDVFNKHIDDAQCSSTTEEKAFAQIIINSNTLSQSNKQRIAKLI